MSQRIDILAMTCVVVLLVIFAVWQVKEQSSCEDILDQREGESRELDSTLIDTLQAKERKYPSWIYRGISIAEIEGTAREHARSGHHRFPPRFWGVDERCWGDWSENDPDPRSTDAYDRAYAAVCLP